MLVYAILWGGVLFNNVRYGGSSGGAVDGKQ